MKKFIKLLIPALGAYLVLGYLIGSFAAADLNIKTWDEDMRKFVAFIVAVFAFCTAGWAVDKDYVENFKNK